MALSGLVFKILWVYTPKLARSIGDTLDGQRARLVTRGGYAQQQQQQQFASDSYALQTCGQQCCVFKRCTKM